LKEFFGYDFTNSELAMMDIPRYLSSYIYVR